MEYGAHLPLIDFGTSPSLPSLKAYASAAAALDFRYLCANDHLVFRRPWLDGLTTLAAVTGVSAEMTLATTVSLPVLRGPVQLAKTLAALDILSDGRLLAAVGPGSSAQDYAAAGLRFETRWRRFDESVQALRALLRSDSEGYDGEFYSTRGFVLEPRPPQQPGPPIWIASWGSPAGLRRVALHGDGWLASAYNTTPDRFRDGLARLSDLRRDADGPTEQLPNAIATAWLYVTNQRSSADRVLRDVLAPMLNRPVDQLRTLSLPIGSAEECAVRVKAFAEAGAQRLFVWPLRDEVAQLELFRERVTPLV